MNSLRMAWFHVTEFAGNGYFLQLLLTTTIGMVALQALAARAPEVVAAGSSAEGYGLGWLRAGMLGTWTVCAVSSGMLGFERYKGTLVHLVFTPHHALKVLLPVLASASVFGLLALPLAAISSWALRQHLQIGGLLPTVLAALVFWLASFSISALIGMLFVLTPHAITYEGLVGVPLVLVSGVFGTPAWLPDGIVTAARVLPTRSAVELLQVVSAGSPISPMLVAESVGASLLWLLLTGLAARVVVGRATRAGTLEVV
jgi:ABC-2 type transport system permease protein